MEDEFKSTMKFTEHLFDGSGNKIMNSIQYTAMSIVPLLLVNSVLETQLPAFSPRTPPLSMVIETAVHMMILLIVLYFVDRVVRYFPSMSGDKYGEVSFETIGLLLVLLVVNSHNSHLGKKVMHLTRHAKERFTSNREGVKNEGGSSGGEPGAAAAAAAEVAAAEVAAAEVAAAEVAPAAAVTGGASGQSNEKFTQQGGGVSPISSLESFALTGGNYSPF
jgi:hypothetical protein